MSPQSATRVGNRSRPLLLMRRRRSTAHQAVRPPDTGLLMRARRVADIKRRVQAGTYLVSLNRLAALLHAALARP